MLKKLFSRKTSAEIDTQPENPPADVLPWQYTGNKLHPTQKPITALAPLINAFSKVGDIVCDPFAGAGSTGVAAQMSLRRFILIEKEEAYCRTARERLRCCDTAVR